MATLVEKGDINDPDAGGRVLPVTMHSLNRVKYRTVNIDVVRFALAQVEPQSPVLVESSVNKYGRHSFCNKSYHSVDYFLTRAVSIKEM